jgi:hypothetical protein
MLNVVSGPERNELPLERLDRWLRRWADEHVPVERTDVRPERVTIAARDGAVVDCAPRSRRLQTRARTLGSIRARCWRTSGASAWSA